MEAKIVKITDKGQITIPTSVRSAVKMKKGDEVIMIQDKNTVIMEKLQDSQFKDLIKHAEKVAAKVWDNKNDEIWDSV